MSQNPSDPQRTDMAKVDHGVSIIIPANNEEKYIADCLHSLLTSEEPGAKIEVIVAANGCSDKTVERAYSTKNDFKTKCWDLTIIDIPDGGKPLALNKGDAAASYADRIYLDADIIISKLLLRDLVGFLKFQTPVYASGNLTIPKAKSVISNYYARFWQKLPFVADDIPGCGVFAVNSHGRKRWEEFPKIISDDIFARSHFSEGEMYKSMEEFQWPITEGFFSLVKVRRRQDAGLQEVREKFPELVDNVKPTRPSLTRKIRLFFSDPVGFTVYSTVAVAVRMPIFKNKSIWYRGR